MLGKTLLAVGMIFLAVLAFTPRGEELDALAAAGDVTIEESSQNPWATQSANVTTYDGWGTSLPRQGDGHFYADAYVNDVSTRFMVDTGASTIALTGEDAEAIGLYWSDEDVQPVARGARRGNRPDPECRRRRSRTPPARWARGRQPAIRRYSSRPGTDR